MMDNHLITSSLLVLGCLIPIALALYFEDAANRRRLEILDSRKDAETQTEPVFVSQPRDFVKHIDTPKPILKKVTFKDDTTFASNSGLPTNFSGRFLVGEKINSKIKPTSISNQTDNPPFAINFSHFKEPHSRDEALKILGKLKIAELPKKKHTDDKPTAQHALAIYEKPLTASEQLLISNLSNKKTQSAYIVQEQQIVLKDLAENKSFRANDNATPVTLLPVQSPKPKKSFLDWFYAKNSQNDELQESLRQLKHFLDQSTSSKPYSDNYDSNQDDS